MTKKNQKKCLDLIVMILNQNADETIKIDSISQVIRTYHLEQFRFKRDKINAMIYSVSDKS